MNISGALSSFFLFEGISDADKEKCISVCKLETRVYSKGEVIYSHSDFEKKIGKIDFDLDKECNRAKFFPKQEYDVCKNFYTTMATVGGGILSSNVITPIIRNKMASNMQKAYIDNKETLAVEKPKLTTILPKNSGLRI